MTGRGFLPVRAAATAVCVTATVLLVAAPASAITKLFPVAGYKMNDNSGSNTGVAAVATAVDSAGNIVAVIGAPNNGSNPALGFTWRGLIKVTTAGVRIWDATIPGNGPYANDVAIDASGNIYVVGAVGTVGTIWKYDSAGTLTATHTSISGGPGWAATIEGALLHVGGGSAGGSNGYLARYNISSGIVENWITTPLTDGMVLGLGRVGTTLYTSHGYTSGGSQGTTKAYQDLVTTYSASVGFTQTQEGGGRLRIGPDGYLYVAPQRLSSGNMSGPSSGAGWLSKLHPVTGEVQAGRAGLVVNESSNGGDCCLSGQAVDFGFSADGSLLVAWYGASGTGSEGVSAGLAAFATTIHAACGGGCFEWDRLWNQSLLLPYFSSDNVQVRALSISGKFAVVGAGMVRTASGDTGSYLEAGVVIFDEALAQNPPAKGTMQVRRNVVVTERDDVAVVVLHGNPYGNVNLSVHGPSGNVVSALRGSHCADEGENCEVQLDANGDGAVTFNGRYNSVTPLRSGVYWIVASGGGVSDRKPVIVKTK